jgi:hypothetical protein
VVFLKACRQLTIGPREVLPCREGPVFFSRHTPRAFAESKTHQPTIRLFFSWLFFSAFLGVSRQGEFKSKNTTQIFLQKFHVENENLFQKNRQEFRCQFFLDLFGFIAFSGVSQRWEFKNTTKNVLYKSHFFSFFVVIVFDLDFSFPPPACGHPQLAVWGLPLRASSL